MWSQDKLDARRRAFYRERFAPTLAPLLELPCERVLVTHGEPVLSGGAAALRAAVSAAPGTTTAERQRTFATAARS